MPGHIRKLNYKDLSINLPLRRPKPDSAEFIEILMGKKAAARVPLVEYLVDETVMRPVVTGLFGRKWADGTAGRESQKEYLDNFIAFWHRLGYDCVRYEAGLPFNENKMLIADTALDANKDRAWADEHGGCVRNWEDFERYPWPKVEDFDFFPFDYINGHLPEGMGFLTCHAGGIFEHLSWIMSLEGLCLAIHEEPGLVKAVSDRIGSLLKKFYDHLLGMDHMAAIFCGDDMGFRTGTLISPADLRKFVLPWHKRFAEMAHNRGVPYFLHSCGKIMAVMPDLIEDVRIDGKHSYEDAVLAAEDFQKRYGDKIAVLGGVDINILAAGTPEDVRKRTRQLIETCGSRGRFAVGSGNSIPSYIPVGNYLAMVDEAVSLSGGHHT